jgi:general secretion pathway protein A
MGGMYLDFYGLREQPFSATPDPKFLFLTPGHREALAQLIYGVQEGKGFIVLTGEVGTGKTTLLRTFMERIGTNTDVAFIFDSTMPFDGLLEYMLEDFGIPTPGRTRAQRLFALNRFLIERRRDGQTAAVIVDEAQNLSLANLEHLRLLSNFEMPTGKLLQIILVGQPELREKLARPELRQLRQRLGMRCAIPPLTPEETRNYIRSRLHVAGASDTRLFTDAAVERIAAYTNGIPRLVNILCDHCLLIGYTDQTRRVEREMVERGIEYLEDGQRPAHARGVFWRPAKRRLRWLVGGLGAAAIGGVTLLAAAVGGVSVPGPIAGQFLDYARLARDLVMR